MSEHVEVVPPEEKLRAFLTVPLQYPDRPGADMHQILGVANRLKWMVEFSRILEPDYPDKSLEGLCREKLTQMAGRVGVGSLEELRIGIGRLRLQLQGKLSAQDWNEFFGERSLPQKPPR